MSPRRGFVALFAAEIISALGSKISLVAVPWLVYETTGSATWMGIVGAAEMVPYLLTSALAAPAADRYGLRRTTVVCDVGSALAMAAVAFAPDAGFGALVLLVAVAGGLRGIGDRVKHAMLRPLAQAADLKLIRVTAAHEGFTRGAALLGAPVGGLLVYWFGATGAIWCDAASFALCAALVFSLVRMPAGATTGEAAGGAVREPYLTALRGGFRYLRRDRLLAAMVGIVFTLNVFSNASIVVFVPLWVADVLRTPAGLGLVLGAFSAGALLGNVGFTVLAPRLPLYLSFALGAAVSGFPRLLVLGLSDQLAVVLAVTFLSGVGIASVNPILGVMLYERVPEVLQTRVIGLAGATGFAGLPVGALLGGWAAAGLGLVPALLVAAGVCALVTAAPLVAYGMRIRPDTGPVRAEVG